MIIRQRNLIEEILLGTSALRRLSVVYCSNNGLLFEVLVRMPSRELRLFFSLPESQHETQLNQDIFALLLNRFKPGRFVEIGANDGFTLSNTVCLEKRFAWNGLLAKANPQYFLSLRNRRSRVVVSAVVDRDGYHEFCSAGLYGGIAKLLDKAQEKIARNANSIKVWETTLDRILKENNPRPLLTSYRWM